MAWSVPQETGFRPTQPALREVVTPLPNQTTIVQIHAGALKGNGVAQMGFLGVSEAVHRCEGCTLGGMNFSQASFGKPQPQTAKDSLLLIATIGTFHTDGLFCYKTNFSPNMMTQKDSSCGVGLVCSLI